MQRIALMGCGNNPKLKIETPRQKEHGGFELVTLDIDKACKPDIIHDLNDRPLPFGTEELDEMHFYDVLEHIGSQGDWETFFEEFTEYWRVLKPNGLICAIVPRWDSMWAWGDPGHVRVISQGTLTFLDQAAYSQVGTTAMTDYRAYWEKSFALVHSDNVGEHQYSFVLQKV